MFDQGEREIRGMLSNSNQEMKKKEIELKRRRRRSVSAVSLSIQMERTRRQGQERVSCGAIWLKNDSMRLKTMKLSILKVQRGFSAPSIFMAVERFLILPGRKKAYQPNWIEFRTQGEGRFAEYMFCLHQENVIWYEKRDKCSLFFFVCFFLFLFLLRKLK